MIKNVSEYDSYQYDVIDINNGHRIPCVQWANDETGEFTCFLWDCDYNDYMRDDNRNLIEYKFKGNIKIVRKEK